MQTRSRKFLLIDAGNTRTKVWQLEHMELMDHFIVDNQHIDSKFAFFSKTKWDFVFVSNTGFDEYEIRSLFPDSQLKFLDHSLNIGIKWAYPKPEQLGKDRIAALIGASKLYPGKNICVVDAGTCITIDCIDFNLNHLGGVIAPGLNMRLKAMHEFTSKLPLSSENELIGVLGNSTSSCLASGSVWGAIAEIEFHFQQFILDGFDDSILIITGGDADFLAAKVKVPNFVVSDLVFQGLRAVLTSLI